MKNIFTIGHSTYPIENFLQLLLKHGINCIADVRSTPFSKYASQYNKDQIKLYLRQNNIQYIPMGEELGARRYDTNLYTVSGYLDFEKVSKNISFKSGIQRIKDGLEKGFRIALMCTEKDPIDCHRSILISKVLQNNKVHIEHIKESGGIETQRQLEERLIDFYFPERHQISIFNVLNSEQSNEALLIEAYKLKNEEIGYKLDKMREG